MTEELYDQEKKEWPIHSVDVIRRNQCCCECPMSRNRKRSLG